MQCYSGHAGQTGPTGQTGLNLNHDLNLAFPLKVTRARDAPVTDLTAACRQALLRPS